jgi:hypothetical protein
MTEPRSVVDTAREIFAEVNRGGPRVATFTRGLAIGALVGAAIAGMAMLDRRANIRRRASEEEAQKQLRP